eukprot:SAG31_NODE_17414_length_671_cov_1.524476_1_plen_141_part_00
MADVENQPQAEKTSPTLTDLPQDVVSHIGQHLSPGGNFRLGVALKNLDIMSVSRRMGEKTMKGYPNDVTFEQWKKINFPNPNSGRRMKGSAFNRTPLQRGQLPFRAYQGYLKRNELPPMVQGVDGKKYDVMEYKKKMGRQ